MLKLAICDDNNVECEAIEKLAKSFFSEIEIAIEITIYNDPSILLNSNIQYDLYLLDIIMPGFTGIDVAARLGDWKHSVVFITSSIESAVDGYTVNADGFIIKPVHKESFDTTMTRVLKKNHFDTEAYITITYNRVPLKLNLDHILFFENRLHTLYVAVNDGKFLPIKGKLNDIQEELRLYSSFLRCHQSYFVNMTNVTAMEDSNFIMKTGEIIPISRNSYKNSKQAYYHYKLR